MSKQRNPPRIPLPRDWPGHVKSAVLSTRTFCSFVREFSPPSPAMPQIPTRTPGTPVSDPDEIFGRDSPSVVTKSPP